MQKYKILWADDEIELLKPHILFLTEKGYDIKGVNSGTDAIDEIESKVYDLVFLDENMPGMSGLETLSQIKSTHPNLPVVMITKSEEEFIMEEAIGAKIADYLIKPLNPNQILLSVKKLLDNERLITEKTNFNYQQEFANLSYRVSDVENFEEWAELYKTLVYWELQIDSTDEKSMSEVFQMQKNEANSKFIHFIKDYYESWLNDSDIEKPLLSNQVLKKEVFPFLNEEKVVFIVIDNLRYDQWEMIEPEISKLFDIEKKDYYYSILPTTTSYARNSLFSGLMPKDIELIHPEYWVGEDEDKPKNNFENELLGENLKRNKLDIRYSYHKIIKTRDGVNLTGKISSLINNHLTAIVYNFVDMLSHARTDMHMIKELAPDESAYRELTKTWFNHSSLFEILKILSNKDVKVIITTDHGTIRVKHPEKIIGDKNTNTNLRFKHGKNLSFDEKKVFYTRNPDRFMLPKLNVSSAYAFATEDSFFAYPNNFNYYVNYYSDTFQHGGVSMEEMIIPLITLRRK